MSRAIAYSFIAVILLLSVIIDVRAEEETQLFVIPSWGRSGSFTTPELLGFYNGKYYITDSSRKSIFTANKEGDSEALVYSVTDKQQSIKSVVFRRSFMVLSLISNTNGSKSTVAYFNATKKSVPVPCEEDLSAMFVTNGGRIVFRNRTGLAYSGLQVDGTYSALTHIKDGAICSQTDTLFWWDSATKSIFARNLNTGAETSKKIPEFTRVKKIVDGLNGDMIAIVGNVKDRKFYNPDVLFLDSKLNTIATLKEDTEFARFYEKLFYDASAKEILLAESSFCETFKIDAMGEVAGRKSTCFRNPVNGPFISSNREIAYVDVIGSLVTISASSKEEIENGFGAIWLKRSYYISPDMQQIIVPSYSGMHCIVYNVNDGSIVKEHKLRAPLLRVGFNYKSDAEVKYAFMFENGDIETSTGKLIKQKWMGVGKRLYPPLKYFDASQPFFLYGEKIMFATDQTSPTKLLILNMNGEISDSFEMDMGFWGVLGNYAGFRTGQEGKIGTYTILNMADGTHKEVKRDLDFDFNQQRFLFPYKDGNLVASISDGKLYVYSLDYSLKASTKGKIELPPALGTINEIGFIIPSGAQEPICVFRSNSAIYVWDFRNKGEIKKVYDIDIIPDDSIWGFDILSFTPLSGCFLIRRKNGAIQRFDIRQ